MPYMITRRLAVDARRRDWTGLHCAHIFLLAYEQHWVEHNYNQWMTVPSLAGGSINSVQNENDISIEDANEEVNDNGQIDENIGEFAAEAGEWTLLRSDVPKHISWTGASRAYFASRCAAALHTQVPFSYIPT